MRYNITLNVWTVAKYAHKYEMKTIKYAIIGIIIKIVPKTTVINDNESKLKT